MAYVNFLNIVIDSIHWLTIETDDRRFETPWRRKPPLHKHWCLTKPIKLCSHMMHGSFLCIHPINASSHEIDHDNHRGDRKTDGWEKTMHIEGKWVLTSAAIVDSGMRNIACHNVIFSRWFWPFDDALVIKHPWVADFRIFLQSVGTEDIVRNQRIMNHGSNMMRMIWRWTTWQLLNSGAKTARSPPGVWLEQRS